MDVLLYTRRGCHLCEAAEEVVADLLPEARVVEVGDDPDLERLWGARVPVLVVGERPVASGRIDAAVVAAVRAGAFRAPD